MLNDHTLKNGARIIACQNSSLHQANIGFYFKGGPLWETKRQNGISHLLEHLFFRRLDQFSQQEIYHRVNRIGAVWKGITYSDSIDFDITVSPLYIRESVDILTLILSDFSWTESEIRQEKEVVLKQIYFKPSESFEEEARRLWFRGTPLSWPIIGEPEIVQSLTVQDIQCYKDAVFRPDNLCCVFTGNFSEKDLEYAAGIIEKAANRSQKPLTYGKSKPDAFGRRSSQSDRILPYRGEISDVVLSFDVDLTLYDEYTVRLLTSILADGDGSLLSMVLREQTGLTDEIYSVIDRYDDYLKLDLVFSCFNKDLPQCLSIVFGLLQTSKSQIRQKDWEDNLVFYTDNQLFTLDSPRDLNFYLAWRRFFLGQPDWTPQWEKERYQQITLDELRKTAAQIFVPDNLSVYVTNNAKILQKRRLQTELQALRDILA